MSHRCCHTVTQSHSHTVTQSRTHRPGAGGKPQAAPPPTSTEPQAATAAAAPTSPATPAATPAAPPAHSPRYCYCQRCYCRSDHGAVRRRRRLLLLLARPQRRRRWWVRRRRRVRWRRCLSRAVERIRHRKPRLGVRCRWPVRARAATFGAKGKASREHVESGYGRQSVLRTARGPRLGTF